MYTITLAAVGVIQFLTAFLVLDAQPVVPQDFGSVISQIQQSVVAGSQLLLQAINDTVLSLTRVAFVTLLILGFFLYFTHLHRRLGKDLMFGGAVLAIISQFVIPAITKA
jgi:hypothetical protein